MKLARPIKHSLPKQISQQIEEHIQSGDLKLGDKIPSEPDLVRQFAVSRNTIREAIQSLIQAGVLESRQGDGTYVVSTGRFEGNIFSRLSGSRQSEVDEARLVIEREIVQLAAKRRTAADLVRIERALLARNSAHSSSEEYGQTDIEFHLAIAKAAGNTILYDLYSSISKFISNAVAQKVCLGHKQDEEFSVLHKELFQAIEDRDGRQAVNLLDQILAIH